MSQHALLQPQEIEVYYVIPALRRHLAMYMKLRGLKQNKIASLLQIDKAAVSQYIKNKRGNKVEFNEDTLNEISLSSMKIKDKMSLIQETQRLLKVIRDNCDLCRIHKLLSPIPQDCNPNVVDCLGGGDGNARICY